MSSCTFYGHHDCSEAIMPELEEVIIDLIEKNDIHEFYVGNHGAFDRMVRNALQKLMRQYPSVRYSVVLAYMPEKAILLDEEDQKHTLLPEGIEYSPKRFAISYRNRWMLDQSEYVICYVNHGWGGAAQFAEKAIRKGKNILNLGSYSF